MVGGGLRRCRLRRRRSRFRQGRKPLRRRAWSALRHRAGAHPGGCRHLSGRQCRREFRTLCRDRAGLLMRILRLIALCLLAAAPATAQDGAEEDKTFLEGWIEGALSGAGREVTISGFEGALSSNATLERMTIADDSGIWFTMEEASLVWSRSALLQGRLDVTELTPERITLSRLPEGEDGLSPEDSQATAFSLPELPVAIDIDQIKAARVHLGAEVLGEPAVLSLESSLSLAEGAGAARLAIRRLGRDDRLTLDAAFSNATRVLDIDLDFDEAEDGLVSRVLRIPGQPQLRLQVEGRAPSSNFTAQVMLSSGGVRRFGGTVQIREGA